MDPLLMLVMGALAGLCVGAAIAGLVARGVLRSERRAAASLEASRESILGDAQTNMREAFQALSAEALQKNNRFFLELAQSSLGELHHEAARELETREKSIHSLVKPVSESLERVDRKLAEIEKERHGHYRELSQQLKAVSGAHERLHSETSNLVKALRAPSVRGQWGEIQLKRVVELAGMIPHCDFSEQVTAGPADQRVRPDLIVHLPGDKSVVVDAKTALHAYLDALESDEPEERARQLDAHSAQVRRHIDQLASKSYWNQFEPAPEFVVMFLPSEGIFSAALERDPSLLEYGVDRGVIVSSPITLIALLQAVAYGWNQEKLARNALDISRLGRELYDRLGLLSGHFEKLGRSLDRAVSSYNDTIGSLEGRVLVSARRLKELGTGSSAEIAAPGAVDRLSRPMQSPPAAPAAPAAPNGES